MVYFPASAEGGSFGEPKFYAVMNDVRVKGKMHIKDFGTLLPGFVIRRIQY